MSKKVAKRTVRIEPNQAVLVADIEDLQHIVYVYRFNGQGAMDKATRDEWYRVADLIEDWIVRSAIPDHVESL